MPRIKVTDNENKILFERMHNGDEEMRTFLIENNFNLACFIAKQSTFKLDDATKLSLCMNALIKAVDMFNPALGNSFSVYAIRSMNNEMGYYYRTAKKENKIYSLDYLLQDKDGHISSNDEYLKDEENPEDIYLNRLLYRNLYESINKLTVKEKRIIILCFGLVFDEMKDIDAAEILNMKKSHLSRDKKIALEKLRLLLIKKEMFEERTPLTDDEKRKIILAKSEGKNIDFKRFRNILNITETKARQLIKK